MRTELGCTDLTGMDSHGRTRTCMDLDGTAVRSPLLRSWGRRVRPVERVSVVWVFVFLAYLLLSVAAIGSMVATSGAPGVVAWPALVASASVAWRMGVVIIGRSF